MKISYALLSQFVDLNGITPKMLADKLTLSGLEVAGLEDQAQALDKVVIGRLLSVKPHPNADKLSLTEVEIPGAVLHIVCGAKNIAPGDVVPVALDGAVLPGNFKIKRSKIRGEESEGMICSERELGLSEEAAGIMHFPAETALGTPVASLLGRDALLEVEVTPNRPDCLSHLGVARQVAAAFGRTFTVPVPRVAEQAPAASDVAAVAAESGSGCGRYCARVIQGAAVGPSPLWLRQALEKLGQRSVNNIVDVTNYVMLEIGHPLHAFDLKKLAGAKVIARAARAGETLTTLDGASQALVPGDLVIADAERPAALAGVMGGLESEVTAGTTEVLLEAAWFDPRVVRRGARRLNMNSESSYRFERGTDPEGGLRLALDRAAQLIAEVSGGRVLQGVLDAWPERRPPVELTLRLARAAKVLGLAVTREQTVSALTRLGYGVSPAGAADEWRIAVPSFRHDVSIEEDLIEDIAQVLGYDQIPTVLPQMPLASPPADSRREFLREVRVLTAGLGLNEAINYSFLDPAQFERLRLPEGHAWRNALAIKNPLNAETALLRSALLPGLLDAVAHNLRRGQDRLFLFEVGAVFVPEAGRELPHEPQHLGLVLAGPRHPLDWRMGAERPQADFYDLKGVLEGLLTRLRLQSARGEGGFRFEPADLPFLHPRIGFELKAQDGRVVGWAGALHPECQERYKFKAGVLAAELDLEALFACHAKAEGIKPFSRFPASVRDLALAVSEATLAGDVMRAIRQAGGPTLVNVIPFDVYRGETLAPGTKSLAFSLTFQAEDKTLQDEDLKVLHQEILGQVQKKFGAAQR